MENIEKKTKKILGLDIGVSSVGVAVVELEKTNMTIKLLSVLTVFTVPYSLIAVKKGNIRAHQRSMFFLYWTGLLVAGLFTLSPGRYLNELLFHS